MPRRPHQSNHLRVTWPSPQAGEAGEPQTIDLARSGKHRVSESGSQLTISLVLVGDIRSHAESARTALFRTGPSRRVRSGASSTDGEQFGSQLSIQRSGATTSVRWAARNGGRERDKVIPDLREFPIALGPADILDVLSTIRCADMRVAAADVDGESRVAYPPRPARSSRSAPLRATAARLLKRRSRPEARRRCGCHDANIPAIPTAAAIVPAAPLASPQA